MRKIICGAFVSLDGVMQAPGGIEEDATGGFKYGGWLAQHWDDDAGDFISGLFSGPFDLLLGRRTYEIFAAHWPYIDDEIGQAFSKATKYVATRSNMPLTWDRSIRLTDASADLARIKEEDGPDLLIQGSTVLIQSLQQAGLIDEYHVLTFPLLLGAGKRLFGPNIAPGALALVRSKVSSKGGVFSTYIPAGPIQCRTIGEDSPSSAELARRERWKREG
jgi:dihydrofolate reductase